MGFQCGIVGLPNVGKSTLFNALTESAAAAVENYPFCTIEPNIGLVPVPDDRVHELGRVAGSAKIVETQLQFVDIAGLVAGASKGEGLGNKFLGNIREVDAIIHVLRCFDDDDIAHVSGDVDPVRDAEIVETELMLADLEGLERRLDRAVKKARGGDKDARELVQLCEEVLGYLHRGQPVRLIKTESPGKWPAVRALGLVSAKPVLYVANVDEASAASGNAYSDKVEELARREGAASVIISAAVEAEIIQLADKSERTEFLESLGLEKTGLAKVIGSGYQLLDLITFFTVGPKEAHAWTVRKGATAPKAAGTIHTDFEHGFIRAETISYENYVSLGGEQAAKDAGKMRLEGKDYLVKDGDVILFRFAN